MVKYPYFILYSLKLLFFSSDTKSSCVFEKWLIFECLMSVEGREPIKCVIHVGFHIVEYNVVTSPVRDWLLFGMEQTVAVEASTENWINIRCPESVHDIIIGTLCGMWKHIMEQKKKKKKNWRSSWNKLFYFILKKGHIFKKKNKPKNFLTNSFTRSCFAEKMEWIWILILLNCLNATL